MVSIDLIIIANFIIIHKTLLNRNHTESTVLATKENSYKNLPSRPVKLNQKRSFFHEVSQVHWCLAISPFPPRIYRFSSSFGLFFRLPGTVFNAALPLVPQSAGKIPSLGVKLAWLWILTERWGKGKDQDAKAFGPRWMPGRKLWETTLE